MKNGNHALLYLIGVPGAGKTTLLNTVLGDMPHSVLRPGKDNPTPAYTLYPGGIQLGFSEGLFGGTDRLPMNVQPRVLDWLQSGPYDRVIAEGDRLANSAFFSAMIALGWRLSVVWLNTPLEIAAARREGRGTKQNRSWVAGRITKIGRLQHWVDAGWTLDGSQPTADLAERLSQHPIVRDIRSGMPLKRI